MNKTFKLLTATVLASSVLVGGCSSMGGMSGTTGTTAAGTGIGAALGAGIGVLIGDSSKAAAIGAGVGAIAGGITGYNWDRIVGKVDQAGGKQLGVQTVKMPDGSLKVVIPEGATFDSGSSALKPAIYPVLDTLASSMVDSPVLHVKAVGNTDNTGSAQLNQRLSDTRASAVASYLSSKGVDGSRIMTEGRSFNDPVASNASVEGRALNRRVELFLYATK